MRTRLFTRLPALVFLAAFSAASGVSAAEQANVVPPKSAVSAPVSAPTASATAPVPVPANTPPSSAAAPSLRDEADARALESILLDQKKLFHALENDPETKRLPFDEQERRVLEIRRRYDALLARRGDDAAVMILYGKFLRQVDDRVQANEWFKKADRLMPNLAVVKHQLGVYAAEQGNYVSALNLLETAVKLEPRTAVYHHHLGEFLCIWRDHLIKDKLLTRPVFDEKMQTAFRKAATLQPEETGYLWRYAESFFDCTAPNWAQALIAWDALAVKATKPLEREMLGLYRARVFIELGQREEAERLLAASKSPQLEASRVKIGEALKRLRDSR
jgi:tetratricopeptide (TPR) repeat protein